MKRGAGKSAPSEAPRPRPGRSGKTKKRRPAGHGALALLASLFLISGGIRVSGLGPYLDASLHAFAASEARGVPSAESAIPDENSDFLLEALTRRDTELRKREEELAVRERALALAEERIEENLQELVEAEQRLRDTIALADGAAADDLEQLTRMYETMKPGEAAALFETMDPNFAAGFLGKMRPDAAAAILAGLAPETAYTISLVLAGRNMRVPAE